MDNQATITIANGGGQHNRIKHIRIKYHMVADAVKRKDIALKYIPTADNEADIFTKAVGTNVFKNLVPKVMGHV